MTKILFVTNKPLNNFGTVLIRCIQPSRFLSQIGFDTDVQNINNVKLIEGGIVIFHRVNFNPLTRLIIQKARIKKNIVIYDTDDLVNTNSDKKDLMKFNAIFVSTKFLQQKYIGFNRNVFIVRNAINQNILEKSTSIEFKSNENKTTLGFISGSNTHDKDFELIESVLIEILKENKNVNLIICGKIKFSSDFYLFENQFKYEKFRDFDNFIKIYELIDINLVPLCLNEFNNGKSEIKYIEASAFLIPGIYSANNTYSEVIEDHKNGLLINKNDKWKEGILKLIHDKKLCKSIALKAKDDVLKLYTPKKRCLDYEDDFSRLY